MEPVPTLPAHPWLARARVIAGAIPTYFVALAFAIGVVRDEVAKALPDSAVSEWVTWAAALVLGVLGCAVAIIRRVTPVLPAERGILPVAPAAPPAGE